MIQNILTSIKAAFSIICNYCLNMESDLAQGVFQMYRMWHDAEHEKL